MLANLKALRRQERLAAARGHVDDDGALVLAGMETKVHADYEHVARWIAPMRELLEREDLSLPDLVDGLTKAVSLRDVGQWLNLYVWAEVTLQRWEFLSLVRHASTSTDDMVVSEAGHLRDDADSRRDALHELFVDLTRFLDRDLDALGWKDRARLITRHRLRVLRREVADVLDVYAGALAEAAAELPERLEPDVDDGTEPTRAADTLQERLARGATTALATGVGSGKDVLNRLGDAGGRAAEGVGRTLNASRLGRLRGGSDDDGTTDETEEPAV